MNFSIPLIDIINFSYDEVEMNEDDPDNNDDYSLLLLPLRNTTIIPRPP